MQRTFGIALRSGNTLDDSRQNILYALSRLARRSQDRVGIATEQVDNLILHFVNHCRIHIDLIEYGDNLQVVAQCKIEVRDCLCLNALSCIDYEQCAFARCDSTRNFIREVDVSRGVNQIECIGLTIVVMVLHLDSVALDCDTFFAFEVHIVEHLRLHFALIKRVGVFEQTVGQCAFAVIDVSDDTEIADIFHINTNFNFARKYTQIFLYII